jgi:hypothetical protein
LKPHWASVKRALKAAWSEAGSDRQVAVPADQRRDQRQHRAQVGRQIDVHVADHVRVAVRPHLTERAAAALPLQVNELDALEVLCERLREHGGPVRARVVGDDDATGEREVRPNVLVEPADRSRKRRHLVVDRDHDVDTRLGREMHGRHHRARG